MSLDARRPGSRPRGAAIAVGAAIVVLAWLPSLATAVIVTVHELSWSELLRLVVTAVVYAPVAAVVIARRHVAIAVIVGALAVNSGWVALALAADAVAGDDPAVAQLLRAVLLWPRVPEVAALAVLPWLLARRRDAVQRIGIALGVVAVASDALVSFAMAAGPVDRSIIVAPFVLTITLFVCGVAVLVGEWRHGSPRERAALGWLGVGGILLLIGYARLALPLPPVAVTVSDAAFVLAQGVLPTAVLAVVLGGRELAADRPLATATVWTQSLAAAVSLYLLVYELAGLFGIEPAFAGAIAAGALALAFASMTRFVRRHAVRLYFGDGGDARAVLARLGERLSGDDDPTAGARGLAEALRSAWNLDSVEIRPASDAGAVRVGTPGPERLRATLHAGGRPVGEIELSGDNPAVLRNAVRPVLDEIAGLIAVAVLLADINHEVAETRRRMLGVRQEERRMLHRELHDELAPALAGIGFGMAAAERLISAGSPEAQAAIVELRRQLAERAEDVRQLARTLLPTALDEGDLDGALRELAQRFTGDGVVVAVHSSGADVLDAGVQLSVYLAAAEAVLRQRRLAGVGRIDVAVRIGAEEVTVRIGADGEPGPAEGPALRAIVERRASDAGGFVRDAGSERGMRMLEAVIPR